MFFILFFIPEDVFISGNFKVIILFNEQFDLQLRQKAINLPSP